MHKKWQQLIETENTAESHKFQDLHSEIMGELRQLGYDLVEVESTIKAVEENRDRFQLSDEQLAARKDFLAASRAAQRDIEASLGSLAVKNKMDEDRKEALLKKNRKAAEDEQRYLAEESKAYLEEQKLLQKQLLAQQEDELSVLEKGTQRLGQVAYTINGELESQQKLLEELNDDVDKELQRMDVVTKGMGALLKTSNKGQIYAVAGAIVLFFILVWMILNT